MLQPAIWIGTGGFLRMSFYNGYSLREPHFHRYKHFIERTFTVVIVSAGSHSHIGSTVSTTRPCDSSTFGGLSTCSQFGPKRHSPSMRNAYVSANELTSAEQSLHSNCDCFALASAVGAS